MAMLDKIVQDYTPRLRAYIRTQVANSDDAEDILQEVFYQLAKTTAGNAGAIEKVSAWLYRVARNAILNFWRKRRESPLLISEPSDDEAACGNLSDILFCPANSEPDNVYLRKLVWRELELALAELPPQQSEVFCLSVFEGMPVKDIAAATGAPVSTVLSRKQYAVTHLRARLMELYTELHSC